MDVAVVGDPFDDHLIDLREQIGLQDVFAGAGGDQMLLGEEHQLVAYPGSQIEVM